MESPFSLLYLVIVLSTFLQLSTISVSGQCLQDQKLSLLDLKQSLLFNRTFSTKLNTWDLGTDCCAWSGVTCDGGRVIGLDLSNETITGGLQNSSGLFDLQFLQNLDLSFNFFGTTLPAGFANLTHLIHLNLSNTGFIGQIPIQISYLTKLITLDLSSSSIYFSPFVHLLRLENPKLATLVQNFTRLEELYLDDVNISAQGSEWCLALSSSLPDLRVLSMSNCLLSGPIEPSLVELKSLSVISLNNNKFSNSVPKFFMNFSNLRLLDLGFRDLDGTFPEEILQLPTLQNLYLSHNKLLQGNFPEFHQNLSLQTTVLSETAFSGTLPESIGGLQRLSRIELVNCSLSGPIPSSMENLTQLVYLDFSDNMFIGSLPSFGMSKSLTYINLSFNKLTGEVSSVRWEDLQRLEYVDLSHNSLSGSIPASLFAIPSLQKILLSFNQIGGQVPEFASPYLSSLNTLDLHSNKLEGSIPRSVFDLRRLVVIVLSYNKFNGTIKLDLNGKLSTLTKLDLSYNNLTVNMSTSNSSLPSFPPQVRTLKLASCNLREFPDLSNHAKLFYLDLSDNKIDGVLPLWVWNVGNGSLQYLNLSGNLLVGLQGLTSFPQQLSTLDLSNNQFQGSIPSLPSFAGYIDLSNNNFTSSIPLNIGDSLFLTVFLSISNNRLTGGIPASICNAYFLEVLDLLGNNLNGTIPACLIEKIDNLGVLNLRRNVFTGNISDNFPRNCGLKTLDLSENQLQWKVPKSLVNCTTLEVLNLGNNQLIGEFPCHLKKISSLRVLVLRSNKFYGSIGCPEDPGTWPKLQIVDIAFNNFGGNLPQRLLLSWEALMRAGNDTYGNLRHQPFLFNEKYYQDSVTVISKGLQMELVKILTIFTSIDFSSNKFEGPIPEVIGGFSELYVLNLSHNALTGQIPSSLGNLSRLESLDLSVNKLSGAIPHQLANLNFLSVLNLSYNQLRGNIPSGNQLQTFAADSFEGNEGLCGLPMENDCSHESPPEVSHSHSGKDINWFLISIELGFIFGFGSFIGSLIFWKRWRIWYCKNIDRLLFRIYPLLDRRRNRNYQRRARRTRGRGQYL